MRRDERHGRGPRMRSPPRPTSRSRCGRCAPCYRTRRRSCPTRRTTTG